MGGILFGRSRDIEGVTGIAGAAGLGGERRLFTGAFGHHMTRLAQNSLKGLGLALRALHIHRVIRLHGDFLKDIPAFKTSKLENGHFDNSTMTGFYANFDNYSDSEG